MFLKFLGFGKDAKAADELATRVRRKTTPVAEQAAEQAAEGSETVQQQQQESGRDSLTKIRAVAKVQKRERCENNAFGHWFRTDAPTVHIPSQGRLPRINTGECPAVPEEDRLKAIDELLTMGANNHFTVEHGEDQGNCD